MQANIIDFKDLTDSKEIMLSKPNPWMARFIYLLIIILIASLTWTYFGEMDEYVKAHGVVRPMEQISTVLNTLTGEVDAVYFYEGKQVKKGDLLYTVSHDALLLDKNNYENQIKQTELLMNHLSLMRKSVDEMRNAFDNTTEEQKPWYQQYKKFETDYRLEEENIKLETQNQEVNQKRLQQERDNLSGFLMLQDSIRAETNLFPDMNNSYALRYEDYRKNVDALNSAINKAKDDYQKAEKMYVAQIASKKEVEELKFQAESAEMKLETYQNQFMLSVSENVESIQTNISDIENRLMQVPGGLRLSKIRNDKLVSLDQGIETEKQRLEQLNNELKSISLRIEDCFVYAKTDGTVHVMQEFAEGDIMQSGIEVARILPAEEEELKIQLALSNSDIANVNMGDNVKFHFYALPYKEYGELIGVISRISSDAQVNQMEGASYYYAEATLTKKDLIGHKGQKGKILVGMTCEAQIIHGSKKILYWLLEKIDLKD